MENKTMRRKRVELSPGHRKLAGCDKARALKTFLSNLKLGPVIFWMASFLPAHLLGH